MCPFGWLAFLLLFQMFHLQKIHIYHQYSFMMKNIIDPLFLLGRINTKKRENMPEFLTSYQFQANSSSFFSQICTISREKFSLDNIYECKFLSTLLRHFVNFFNMLRENGLNPWVTYLKWSLIAQVKGVLRRTFVGDWRFNCQMEWKLTK